MKVTRLKKGYRINLSDSDMGMLKWIVADGESTWQGDENALDIWRPAEKASFTRRSKGGGLLRIDEDRR